MLLPTTRCLASVAPGSSAGSASREQEAEGLETSLPDSLAWSNPGRGVAGHSADAASFSHQAAAVGLRRLGNGSARFPRLVPRPSASCSRLADPAELPGATLARHRVVGNNIQL